jgi:hypothetical protein
VWGFFFVSSLFFKFLEISVPVYFLSILVKILKGRVKSVS